MLGALLLLLVRLRLLLARLLLARLKLPLVRLRPWLLSKLRLLPPSPLPHSN